MFIYHFIPSGSVKWVPNLKSLVMLTTWLGHMLCSILGHMVNKIELAKIPMYCRAAKFSFYYVIFIFSEKSISDCFTWYAINVECLVFERAVTEFLTRWVFLSLYFRKIIFVVHFCNICNRNLPRKLLFVNWGVTITPSL